MVALKRIPDTVRKEFLLPLGRLSQRLGKRHNHRWPILPIQALCKALSAALVAWVGFSAKAILGRR